MRASLRAAASGRGGPAVVLGLLAALAMVQPASAQADGEDAPQEPRDESSGPSPSAPPQCIEYNSRAYEAALVVRQHAASLSAGFEPEARPQALQILGWMDQWMGRLRVLVELAEGTQCLDEGDLETYRRALAIAVQVGNQARADILRPVRPPQQGRARR